MTGHDYAFDQIARAQHGHADHQCPRCGVYRTDGQPPADSTHSPHCTRTITGILTRPGIRIATGSPA